VLSKDVSVQALALSDQSVSEGDVSDPQAAAAQAISVEQARATLQAVMLAMFYRWAANENVEEPTQAQKYDAQEREDAYQDALDALIAAAVRAAPGPEWQERCERLGSTLTALLARWRHQSASSREQLYNPVYREWRDPVNERADRDAQQILAELKTALSAPPSRSPEDAETETP